ASAPATPPAGQVTGSTAADKTTIDVEAKQKS
ncbi:MAG TPA: twin-arginine translocase subunit TatA, partial [Giesbergeria sp.]|nr:twin-arginine translocase subunit TatA [Giesbergeria sp.]